GSKRDAKATRKWAGAACTPSSALRGLYADRELPLVLVVLHELMCPRRLREVEDLVEHRPDLPLDDQLVRPLRLVRVREVRSQDLLLPHPQVAHVELQVVARGSSADH